MSVSTHRARHHRRVGDAQAVDPRTRNCRSTTLASSLPIRQVPKG
ncbi:dehydrogenase fad flavoGmc oxidoreductase domain protein [Mycobacterium ulcerans str. Harvey]|uniref:Dehydrogenase fad flavoGmc oxidoreductase domain protein n=1 Tax=Mycobacterium ulcerans str. Harvey TaxID=1299332 RepID=A0ABP3A6F6_MYCUL|nr:dehydrogenase fad flavoGmc oxidoreductase domain protein [Mycobacterium ulcerans str. Harvey]